MSIKALISAVVLSLLLFPACANGTREIVEPETIRREITTNNKNTMAQTGWTTSVPDEYLRPSSETGTVYQLTYPSRYYAGNGAEVTKTAYVYVPYGYDQSDTLTRYDIMYLMHGWGGHAGEYFEMANIRNLLDNMIQRGDIKPTIFVSATFYNPNSSSDFSSSVRELRAFHQDFEENLMPAVEGTFHTYAKSTDVEDLKASRDHRAFGGFSLGAVTTWMSFCYDTDFIRYFLPMSGSSWYYGGYGDFRPVQNVDHIEEIVRQNNLSERGYFIYEGVGTNDTVKSQTLMMMEEMLKRDAVFTPDHLMFYQKQGGVHDFVAVREFMFNALPLFFRDTSGEGNLKALERGSFLMDNVMRSAENGIFHYNVHVPESYDGSKPYGLHIALPGWEGLYFQGLGEDLRWEYLPYQSSKYADDLIVVSPQLNDWGLTSAKQAVELTRYFLAQYNIDPDRVYISGYSGGGETLSRVMELAPELYSSALFVSSQWDGDPAPLADAQTPLYIFTSAHDSYYSAEPARRAWQRIHDLYVQKGLSEDEIGKILVLDVREDSWFDDFLASNSDIRQSGYATDYHGAGMLVAFDPSVMEWVFGDM